MKEVFYMVSGATAIFLIATIFLRDQKHLYEALIQTLTSERDMARQEAKVYRAMILPGYERVATAAPAPAMDQVAQPGQSAPQSRASARRPRGVSSRQWFNLLRAKTNSKQQHIDKIAEAILEKKAKVSPQGENHV
jgi:hypothetical protein